ncbi:MAG TPA: cupin domain-containing protein [Longimicrobiaceae bacterium]|nr:cupin domain-containing protein [Longimicrobiaceae bacterium]
MTGFQTARLPIEPSYPAPDGSEVRVLLGVGGGGMAHFQLGPGLTSRAAAHRTVDEIWYVLSGRGEMWRAQEGAQEEVVALEPGVCLTIPVGTRFQFRCLGDEPLAAIGVTMPPWPEDREEAYEVEGRWVPTVV